MSPERGGEENEAARARAGSWDLAGRVDRLGGALGVAAVGALVAGLTPGLTLPAWPAVTLGALAVLCALPAGRPAWRGLAAFLGALGVLGGAVQIAGLWYVIVRFGG